jgi:DNA-directed RNA polymerase subunit alpha
VLLSSIQGYAISSIRITSYDDNGIPHVISSEFEAIPNVSEDTLEIINSLKQIRLRLPEDVEQDTIMYEFKGPGEVKSNDFAKEGQLEIMTKDKLVFTMMEGAHLDVEIQIDLGRGYVPAETNEHYIEIVGTIPMDAIFTPVEKVKYAIEPCRVGQRNDYDKLVLEIWTDGTITPEDALGEAAKIAKEHFAIFINFNDKDVIGSDENDEGDESIAKLLSTPVEELELSVRSSNCLKNANIRTIGELTKKTEDDIAKTRNFGKKSLAEIKEKLQEWNLTLGMTDYSHLKNAANITKQKEETDES